DIINVNRGRLGRDRRACKVEIDSRRRCAGRSGNGVGDQGISVVSGSKSLVTRVPSGVPQNSPLCALTLTARQCAGVESERIGGSSRHGNTGLIDLNDPPST